LLSPVTVLKESHTNSQIPTGRLTKGNISDAKVAQQFRFDPSTIAIDDRKYNAYEVFGRWIAQGI
jgi:hypothetical protein